MEHPTLEQIAAMPPLERLAALADRTARLARECKAMVDEMKAESLRALEIIRSLPAA